MSTVSVRIRPLLPISPCGQTGKVTSLKTKGSVRSSRTRGTNLIESKMTKVEELAQRLMDMHVTGFGVTWGEDAHTMSAEERAGAILDAFDMIERGEWEEMPQLGDSHMKRRHVDEFLNNGHVA